MNSLVKVVIGKLAKRAFSLTWPASMQIHWNKRKRLHKKRVQISQDWFGTLRACLHGGGGPQIGEVTCGRSPHLSCELDQIKMRDFVDRQVTHQSELPHLAGVPHLHVNRP